MRAAAMFSSTIVPSRFIVTTASNALSRTESRSTARSYRTASAVVTELRRENKDDASMSVRAAMRVRSSYVVEAHDGSRAVRTPTLFPPLALDERGHHLALLVARELLGGVEVRVAEAAGNRVRVGNE